MPLTHLYEKHFLIGWVMSLTPTSVITVICSDRSSQCPWIWVGKWTCWRRPKYVNKSVNVVVWFDGLSKCKLKSPKINNSPRKDDMFPGDLGIEYWPIVYDHSPALHQHWLNDPCSLYFGFSIDDHIPSKLIRIINPMLFQRWAIVSDSCPTLKQHWSSVLCFLGFNASLLQIHDGISNLDNTN